MKCLFSLDVKPVFLGTEFLVFIGVLVTKFVTAGHMGRSSESNALQADSVVLSYRDDGCGADGYPAICNAVPLAGIEPGPVGSKTLSFYCMSEMMDVY